MYTHTHTHTHTHTRARTHACTHTNRHEYMLLYQYTKHCETSTHTHTEANPSLCSTGVLPRPHHKLRGTHITHPVIKLPLPHTLTHTHSDIAPPLAMGSPRCITYLTPVFIVAAHPSHVMKHTDYKTLMDLSELSYIPHVPSMCWELVHQLDRFIERKETSQSCRAKRE